MSATLQTSLKEKIIESVEIPILTRCCFCFPLRKGLIAFAYVNTISTDEHEVHLVVGSGGFTLGAVEASVQGGKMLSSLDDEFVHFHAYCSSTMSMLTLAVTIMLSMYISYVRVSELPDGSEYPRLIADTTALVLEVVMSVIFIVALHTKHVLLMKVYLYFEIVFSTIGFVYSLAFLNRESASELFLILFQLMVQIYLVILIWSSIVKMERDDTVKYTRNMDTA